MVKISYTLNVGVPFAVIGCCGLCIVVMIYACSSFFLLIRIGFIRRKTSRNTQWSVYGQCRSQYSGWRHIQALFHGVVMYSCSYTMTQSLCTISSDELSVHLYIRVIALVQHYEHTVLLNDFATNLRSCWKLQLGRCYRQSTALKCQPKHNDRNDCCLAYHQLYGQPCWYSLTKGAVQGRYFDILCIRT
jgi:hypothetical protein